jgi:hypothetical protein
VALVAAGVAFSVYVVGFIASFWLPEPPPEVSVEVPQDTLAADRPTRV